MSISVQRRIRVLALAVIAAGTMTLATPRTAVAEVEPGDVCCQVGSGPKCCGGACSATATNCEACSTWFSCLIFGW